MAMPIGTIMGTFIALKFFNKMKVTEIGLLPLKHFRMDFAWGLGLGAVSITIIFLISWGTGAIAVNNSLLEPNFTNFSWKLVLLFVLVGFSEELFFRGYVMKTMEVKGNRKPVIYIFSAIFFSIVHGMNPNVSMIGLLNVGLVGLLFAYMLDCTQNLWMPIGFHITWNYFQGPVFGFPVSGLGVEGLNQMEIIQGKEWLSGGEFGPEAGVLGTLLILANYMVVRFIIKRQPIVSNSG